MEKDLTHYIPVGKIGSTYGVHGWLKILAYTEYAETIFNYSPWYLSNSTSYQSIQVEDWRPHGKGCIAKLAGIESPEQARLFLEK